MRSSNDLVALTWLKSPAVVNPFSRASLNDATLTVLSQGARRGAVAGEDEELASGYGDRNTHDAISTPQDAADRMMGIPVSSGRTILVRNEANQPPDYIFHILLIYRNISSILAPIPNIDDANKSDYDFFFFRGMGASREFLTLISCLAKRQLNHNFVISLVHA